MKHKILLSFATFAISLAAMLGLTSQSASAAFLHNRIMDDPIFSNAYTMNAVQIDNFLNGFPNSCISPNSGFSAVVPNGYNETNGFSYGGYTSAGGVIATAAQVYGINPQVLLVTLEKEQSLVSGRNNFATYCNATSQHKYAAAAGYGCPDSGGSYSYSGISLYRRNGTVVSTVSSTCVNSQVKAGFSQQVIRAAWLLRFGQQRSLGNVGWAVVSGSWDNSDDPQSCYSGPMTEGMRQICPSGPTTYYSGIKNIDGEAVHMDSGATAALYWYTPHFHGNQLFSDLYNTWFGNSILPYAFTSPSGSPIYLYASGYKIAVPAMGVLQDFGVSPQSIQTVSQATIDSIPTPQSGDGVSATLSYLIKSPSDSDGDGASVYLVTVGQKYQIATMQQFADFGFDQGNIAYLPLSYINSLPGSQTLSNYIQLPTSAVFQVASAQKRIIFEYSTYQSVNPSDAHTQVSYYTANLLASGMPLVSHNVLVKKPDSQAVYVLSSGNYYTVPTFNAYTCWGFDAAQGTPLYTVGDGSYIGTITPTGTVPPCLVTASGTTYMMSGNTKYTVPGSYGISGTTTSDANIISMLNTLPSAATPLKQYIKSNAQSAVWFLEGGVKKPIPSYSNFALLGVTSSQIDTLDNSAVPAISTSSLKLGQGQLVKTDTSGAVYVISGSNRLLFARSIDYEAYGNRWEWIETYPAATLDAAYPYAGVSVSPWLYDAPSGKVYLIDKNGCYYFTPAMLTHYGLNQSTISSAQSYASSIFVNIDLPGCRTAVQYAKQTDGPGVYWVENGTKRAFSTWSGFLNHAGSQNPFITTVSPPLLNSITTGPPL